MERDYRRLFVFDSELNRLCDLYRLSSAGFVIVKLYQLESDYFSDDGRNRKLSGPVSRP